jgi:capsule polysaccharide export protein KpsC/LpsZ
VNDFYQDSSCRKSGEHRTGGIDEIDAVCTHLGLPMDKKKILFLSQVRTDASIVLDSTIYPDPLDLVGQLVDIVDKNKDLHLVIRLHPKECIETRFSRMGKQITVYDDLTLRKLQLMPFSSNENITVVTGTDVSTTALMDICEAGVTVNSQGGLEMAIAGKPVITAGRCFYAHQGFTLDLPCQEMLQPMLDLALSKYTLTPEEQGNLNRFLYYMFFHYLVPRDLSYGKERLLYLMGKTMWS